MYLFDHDQWADLYVKNCSLKSPTYWQAAGHASIPLGMLYATFGAICEVIFLVLSKALASKNVHSIKLHKWKKFFKICKS